MRRRWPLALLLVLAAGALAVLALPRLLDVERHRARIESALGQATGCAVDLGAIDLSLWPPGVRVSPVRLAPPRGESRVAVHAVEVRAAPWPLLRGRLEIREIRLVAPELSLVRTAEGFGVPWPGAAPAGAAGDSPGGGPVVGRIVVEHGLARVEDRVAAAPWSLALEELNLELDPAAGRLRGAARLGRAGGRLDVDGSLADGLALELAEIDTGTLAPWLGADLLRPGGRVSGRIEMKLPGRLTARLAVRALHLVAGAVPFPDARLEADLALADGAWLLERLGVAAPGVELRGRGRLSPGVELELVLPPTPLEPALALARAVVDLPVAIEPPGTAQAVLRVASSAAGEIGYEARGTLSAARIHGIASVPEATDLAVDFALSPAGELTLSFDRGRLAEGTLTGTARLARVSPPGRLSIDGELAQASLGRLLAGFVAGDAGRIGGRSAALARLSIDLGRQPLDARALGGRLELRGDDVRLPGLDFEAALRETIADKLSALGGLVGGAPQAGSSASAAAEQGEVIEHLEVDVDLDVWPWRLQEVALRAGDVTVTGAGTLDAESGALDLDLVVAAGPTLTARLVERHQALRALAGAQGTLAVPARLGGTLVEPRLGVDAGELVRRSLGPGESRKAVKSLVEDLLQKARRRGSR